MRRILLVLLIVFIAGSIVVQADGVSDWAKGDVSDVFESDIISDDYFLDYQNQITRQEYGYLMYQLYEYLAGEPISGIIDIGTSYAFADTSDLYLIALSGSKLLTGYPDGTFRPENPITREEIMVLYIRLLEKVGYTFDKSSHSFNDESEISNWAYDSVKKCVDLGIIKGREGNMLDPKGNATIEESLVVLNRIMNHESITAAESKVYSVGSSIVSNGSRTYAVSYDLIGNPIGIDEFRDYDFVTQVVTGIVGERLCISGTALYYEDESGRLAVYNGSRPNVDVEITDTEWFVSEDVLYVPTDSGYMRYSSDTGQMIDVTIDGEANARLLLNDGKLTYDGIIIGSDVSDYEASGDRVFILTADKVLSVYEIKSGEFIEFGYVNGTSIDITGNYLVMHIPMHNNTTFVQYMPIFDIRRFTGN